jgi:hypothetical protein
VGALPDGIRTRSHAGPAPMQQRATPYQGNHKGCPYRDPFCPPRADLANFTPPMPVTLDSSSLQVFLWKFAWLALLAQETLETALRMVLPPPECRGHPPFCLQAGLI